MRFVQLKVYRNEKSKGNGVRGKIRGDGDKEEWVSRYSERLGNRTGGKKLSLRVRGGWRLKTSTCGRGGSTRLKKICLRVVQGLNPVTDVPEEE